MAPAVSEASAVMTNCRSWPVEACVCGFTA
jgi:hypothetical protein